MSWRFGSMATVSRWQTLSTVFLGLMAATGAASAADEEYVHDQLPPGIQVVQTEINGPVYADASGHTIYRWNAQYVGAKDNPACDGHIVRKSSSTPGGRNNAGGEQFYPEGILPDADKRVPCEKIWPAVAAPADAQAFGRWTIFVRPDGFRQWRLNGFPLYTSDQDHEPGDVNGGTNRLYANNAAGRVPVGPAADVPPGFAVVSSPVGRLLTSDASSTVFMSDNDPKGKSLCVAECAKTWNPILAPGLARSKGDWSVIDRGAGVGQWAYKGKALYTYTVDQHRFGLQGADIPGWQAVIMKAPPPPPSWVTVQDTVVGTTWADSKGHTLYQYNCAEPAEGDLACDNPTTTQVYRLWMCGYSDAQRCAKTWPLVPVLADATSVSKAWTTVVLNPLTGRFAKEGEPGAVRVWAYRGRPIYTYAGDKQPGEMWGDSVGEGRGGTNGFTAFRIRSSELYPGNGN